MPLMHRASHRLEYLCGRTLLLAVRKLHRQDVFEYVSAEIKYQKRTIAFLREILNYYGISNSLSGQLSALTRYNYPKMEKINELARV